MEQSAQPTLPLSALWQRSDVQPIAGQPGTAWIRAWFRAWVQAHVILFMIIFNTVERFNDYLLSSFISMAIPYRETVHQAVARGDVRKVQKLVRKGADLSTPDNSGRTALHVALEKLEALAEEMEDAADDATEEEAQSSAATLTTTRGPSSAEWLEMLRCLLHHQASIDARDTQDRAPIHVAVRAGLHEAARLLIDAGAEPTMLCKGRSTLHQAVLRGDPQMVALLLDAAKMPRGGPAPPPVEYVNGIGPDGWSALGLAARAGHVATVKALLDAGADRAAVNRNGKTVLDIARLNKRVDVVRLLES
jgi:ankyrin repeat protein